MALNRPDGTPFSLPTGPFRIYNPADPNNPTNRLFSELDAESIRIGGSPIFYYEVLIQPNTVDRLYLEDRGKIFSPCPVQLYAIYEPPDQIADSTLFGVDTPNMEVVFEMNANATIAAIGHPPKVGSRIFTPHLCQDWIVIDRRQGEFRAWGALHYLLYCQKFPYNKSDGTDRFQTQRPEFPIQ